MDLIGYSSIREWVDALALGQIAKPGFLRLPKMAERNCGSIQKIRHGPELPRDAISLAHFDVAIPQLASVENQNLRERRIPPETRRNGHVDPIRHQIRKIEKRRCGLVQYYPLGHALTIARPERPANVLPIIRRRKASQPVNPPAFPAARPPASDDRHGWKLDSRKPRPAPP